MDLAKKKTPTVNIRSSYYEASDRLLALSDKAHQSGDEELKKLALELLKQMRAFEDYLDENYRWD